LLRRAHQSGSPAIVEGRKKAGPANEKGDAIEKFRAADTSADAGDSPAVAKARALFASGVITVEELEVLVQRDADFCAEAAKLDGDPQRPATGRCRHRAESPGPGGNDLRPQSPQPLAGSPPPAAPSSADAAPALGLGTPASPKAPNVVSRRRSYSVGAVVGLGFTREAPRDSPAEDAAKSPAAAGTSTSKAAVSRTTATRDGARSGGGGGSGGSSVEPRRRRAGSVGRSSPGGGV